MIKAANIGIQWSANRVRLLMGGGIDTSFPVDGFWGGERARRV